MPIRFLKHFIRGDDRILAAGLSPISDSCRDARTKLNEILTSKKIKGSRNKGYFYRDGMPPSVSFTGESLENLGRFFAEYGQYSLVFSGLRAKDIAKPVLYLSDEQIQLGAFREEDKWRVDVCRPCSLYEEDYATGESTFIKKRHDYSWEKEWRIKCSAIGFEKVDFVMVPTKDEVKRINQNYGQEAYDVSNHGIRGESWAQSRNNPPNLEEMLYQELVRLKQEKPEGFIMQEVTELAWDKLRIK